MHIYILESADIFVRLNAVFLDLSDWLNAELSSFSDISSSEKFKVLTILSHDTYEPLKILFILLFFS